LSKSALATATVTQAQAQAPKIRVNALAPGPTLPSPRHTPEQFAVQAALVPLKRGPTPEDIAAAVVYLAGAQRHRQRDRGRRRPTSGLAHRRQRRCRVDRARRAPVLRNACDKADDAGGR
jgi:NAD(P)-dependent dehydrogenase (short-subunit alcohol dehydrogenase family)